ncbi:hypothetical protein [Burkholderia mayonis]|uniref:hypothetical protein n=1 Tax=Burkholderia mayonis TaxID=1385591 RepID=UPI000ACEBACA|nr:hypothetical protein [Burkholderia mayonis]
MSRKNPAPMPEKGDAEVIATLQRQLVAMQMRLSVQSAALHAIARTHPEPDAALKDFRGYVERVLAMPDSNPAAHHGTAAASAEANSVIEALRANPNFRGSRRGG